MSQGTESLTAIAVNLQAVALAIREFRATRKDAETVETAAAALCRLAPLDPDIDVVKGDS